MLKVDVYFQLWTRRTRNVQEKFHPRCSFSGPMPGQIAFDFEVHRREWTTKNQTYIARGWSYSQQANLYLKKAALHSLENPRILWSCQPLISKGSLADRDVDLSYGAREVWFWHQICRYYTVCHHVEAYTLGRLSIDGFSFERVAQSNLEWIFSKLDSGFQSLVGFRIPSAGFRIPKPRILDSTSKKFLDSGIRIPLNGAIFFYINAHGILCLKIIAVVNEGAIVLDICTTLKGSPDFAAGTARAFHKLLGNFLHSEQFL